MGPPCSPPPLPCTAQERVGCSQGTCLAPAEPPDSASVSPVYAASFCPHCTSFRKERMKEWLMFHSSLINEYPLCAEPFVFRQHIQHSILKCTGWLQAINWSRLVFAILQHHVTYNMHNVSFSQISTANTIYQERWEEGKNNHPFNSEKQSEKYYSLLQFFTWEKNQFQSLNFTNLRN